MRYSKLPAKRQRLPHAGTGEMNVARRYMNLALILLVVCLLKNASVFAEDRQVDSRASLDQSAKSTGTEPEASTKAGEAIPWQVIACGGGEGTSTNWQMAGTVGQCAVGYGASTNWQIQSGFWQNFVDNAGCCTGPSVGNVDGSADNLISMGDLVALIDHMFISLAPLLCEEEANVDMSADGIISMGDLVTLINHLFITLDPLPACP